MRDGIPSPKARQYLQALQAPPVYFATCCFDCMRVFTTLDLSGKFAVCDKCGVFLPWLVRLNEGSWEGRPTAKRMLAYAKRFIAGKIKHKEVKT
jgi:hypothetical protein